METTTTSAGPSRALVIAVFAALLFGGILGGIAIDRAILLGHRPHRAEAEMLGGPGMPGGPGRPGHMDEQHRTEMRGRMVERLSRELNLSADQRTKVEAMLPRHMAAFDSLRASMAPRLRALLDSSQAEMEAILTPEQAAKWRTLRRDGPGHP